MTTPTKHRCGGTLKQRQVIVATNEQSSAVALVQGLKCDKCGEEVIDRQTATRMTGVSVEPSTLLSWNYSGSDTTPPVDMRKFTLSSGQGTLPASR